MALLSYYDIGFATVANGSTAVTGTGTQWLTALRENDVFVGADGRSIRIASVNSATSLTLARAWPGASQTGGAYEVRITPAPSEITASVRELLEKLRQGLWLTPNATGTLAERAGYDSARRGFIYMQTDVDPFVVFVKQTDTAGDWSPGFSPQQGPSGPFTTIEIGTVTTVAPDQPATIDAVQVGDTVTLTFNIPRGPTGDINGVTPFWNTRLGSDADAPAARTGLGATTTGDALFTAASVSAAQDTLGLGNAMPDAAAAVSIDWNTIIAAGYYPDVVLGSGTNGPGPGEYYYVQNFTALGRVLQFAIPYSSTLQSAGAGADNIYYRLKNSSNVWAVWRTCGAPILGTVVQVGGQVRGAIIERGSNGNGEYVRLADGTQICAINYQVTNQAISNVYGSLFEGSRLWSYPASFIIAPSVACSQFNWGSGGSWGSVVSVGASSATLRGTDAISRAAGTFVNISAVAIGRWF